MKNFSKSLFLLVSFIFFSSVYSQEIDLKSYLSYDDPQLKLTGGVKMVPVETPIGIFNVFTQQVGNNPKVRVLLLHGGPGATHELYEPFMSYFPKEGIEFIYYDQLGSYYSDQPDDKSLWTIERFVDEVEQVRKALGLNKDNFYLFGQSWGGVLAMEYALKYQDNLKGLIISNMVASAPEYNKYAKEVLGPQLDPEVLAEIQELEKNKDFENPRYMELLIPNHYTKHILRMPVEKWPNSIDRTFEHLNPEIYVYMQGPSEFGITPEATLANWDISDKLKTIKVPSLVIGAKYDTMDPEYMEWMSREVKNGRFLLCPEGSHLSQYDDPEHFFPGLIGFIKDVNNGDFQKN
ncbi:proline iminopeptidase-family hydrolase [Gramella jeungdoensis]|uniref:Proline iminopeptidase-family hydrolase n=1 Tax=Gramella jeungdoensis TaxID=708091 RepID=A0ABT0YZW1_9FLAO|nr:proline iminopeptidase-family hydrolase [Gramella jeungdoensis]MCM8568869.1 proline iminopeptidase-family hydrolase [Gramella jeungdoensis]